MTGIRRQSYGPKEVAAILGVGVESARQLMRSESFPALKIGRGYITPIPAFEKWMLEYTKGGQRNE